MLFSFVSILISILWIILGTSVTKIHPFLVLFSAALLLAFLLGISPIETLNLIQGGFGQIIEKIGLLILFGTVIGVAMEKSNATLTLAKGILKIMNRLPLPYAISCIGYLVSIPVFCDAAFVILSHLNKTLSRQTKTPLVGLTVALSTGLFAPHVLVPPTPGPLAAAANLELDNLFLLIAMGAVVALILILVGGAYGNYLSKKNTSEEPQSEPEETEIEKILLPSFAKSILPIALPIVLMCLGTLLKIVSADLPGLAVLSFVTNPTVALAIGMLVAFSLTTKQKKAFLKTTMKKGIAQAAPILMITGMGGALGSIIQTI